MIYKNKSSKYIISRIFSTFHPEGNDWVFDAIEWTGDALKLIGQFPQFEKKREGLTIRNHRASLPCDFYMLETPGVYYAGLPIPYNGAVNAYSAYHVNDGFAGAVQHSMYSYDLTPNYLITSMESTGKEELYIIYRAIPVDEEGFPMIPDRVEFELAIMWYVVYNLILSGQLSNKNIDLHYAEAKWEKYLSQAESAGSAMNGDQMDRFVNAWKNLVTEGGHGTSFLGTFDRNKIGGVS